MNELPEEVLLYILEFIPWKCVCSVGQVSRRLRDVVNSNILWQFHYNQRFCKGIPLPGSDWKEEFVVRHKLLRNLHHALKVLSTTLYNVKYVGPLDFFPLEILFDSDEYVDVHVEEELKRILKEANQTERLTERYYARLAYHHVVHRRLVYSFCSMLRKLEQFREASEDFVVSNVNLDSINTRASGDIYLETGAIYIAQWFRPEDETADEEVVMRTLDGLADKVRQSLPPKHSQRDILLMISRLLFSPESECGMTKDEEDPHNTLPWFINCVIQRKRGIAISLSLIYHAVARRLGVHVEPVNVPGYFLLRWIKFPELNGSDKYEYIDVYKGGKMMPEEKCDYIASNSPFSLKEATHSEVWLRMSTDLEGMAEYLSMSQPDYQQIATVSALLNVLNPSVRSAEKVVLFYSDMQIKIVRNPRLIEVLDTLKSLNHLHLVLIKRPVSGLHNFDIVDSKSHPMSLQQQVMRRGSDCDVKFGVGLVMHHLRYDYECVIYGWDLQCQMPSTWIRQMKVHQLPLGPKQTFYNVLVSDGSRRYAAQENLEPMQNPVIITNNHIGKYFEGFNGRYYVLNDVTAAHYPDDTDAFRNSFFSSKPGSSKDATPTD